MKPLNWWLYFFDWWWSLAASFISIHRVPLLRHVIIVDNSPLFASSLHFVQANKCYAPVPTVNLSFYHLFLNSLYDLIDHNDSPIDLYAADIDELVVTAVCADLPPVHPTFSLSDIYPLFSDCVTFDDLVYSSIAANTSILDLDRARLAATASLGHPDTCLDIARMHADSKLLVSHGASYLFDFRQPARAAKCVSSRAIALTVPGSLLWQRVSSIAFRENHWLFPSFFVPNMGVGIIPYPTSFAPHSVIAAHFALLQRADKCIVLRESVWLA